MSQQRKGTGMANILVVEDSLTIISAVEQTLRSRGHNVYLAHDGMSALACVRAFVPDLIFLDVLLPHVNGLDVCATIRRNPIYRSIPIVVMSGLTSEDDIKRAYQVGASDYIKKPVNEELLLGALDQHLSGAPAVA
jgi:CheY-like chemotaxis protein